MAKLMFLVLLQASKITEWQSGKVSHRILFLAEIFLALFCLSYISGAEVYLLK